LASAFPYDGHDVTVDMKPGGEWQYDTTSSGSTSSHRWYSNDPLSGTAPSSGSETVSKRYYEQYYKSFAAQVASSGLALSSSNYIPVTIRQLGSGKQLQAYDGHNSVDWADAGSSYSYSQQSTGSGSSERWRSQTQKTGTVTDGNTILGTFYHQYKPSVTLNGTDSGHQAAADYKQFGDAQSHTAYGSWSEWCDRNSTLTFSQQTTGSPPYVTSDPRSWTVTSSFGATINYIPPDNPPTVNITSPADGSSTSSSTITVQGTATASDDHQVTLVEVRINSGNWQTASGTTSWSKSVTLSQGPNTIEARAQDNASQYSPIASIQVTYIPPCQPDMLIRDLGDSVYAGDGIYNSDGTNQTKSETVSENQPAVYELKVENDGDASDSFTITGTVGGSGWTVTYYDALTGGSDITGQVTGLGWHTGSLAVGDSRQFRVEVTPGGTVAAGASKEILVTATSDADNTKSDAVKAVTSKTGGASIAVHLVPGWNLTSIGQPVDPNMTFGQVSGTTLGLVCGC